MLGIALVCFIGLFAFGGNVLGWTDPAGKVQLGLFMSFLFGIVCGYRTPQSNRFLRTRSARTGVAEHSQHMLAKAIDIRVPGVSTARLRNAALSLGEGGVGYYPTSRFVHVDVGPVREWTFGARKTRRVSKRVPRHVARTSVGE